MFQTGFEIFLFSFASPLSNFLNGDWLVKIFVSPGVAYKQRSILEKNTEIQLNNQ